MGFETHTPPDGASVASVNMAPHLFLSAVVGLGLNYMQPHPTLHTVQKFITADAARCATDLRTVRSRGISGQLEERISKTHAWMQSRSLIVRWGVEQLVCEQFALNQLEHFAINHITPFMPFGFLPEVLSSVKSPPARLTLRAAIKPLGPWALTRHAFVAAPGRTMKLLWKFTWLGLTTPFNKSEKRRRIRRALLADLAATYELL